MQEGQLKNIEKLIIKTAQQSEDRLRGDLKQFIEATVSQSEERIKTELGGQTEELCHEMREGFKGVAKAFEELDKSQITTDKRLQQHEQRLKDHDEQFGTLQPKAA